MNRSFQYYDSVYYRNFPIGHVFLEINNGQFPNFVDIYKIDWEQLQPYLQTLPVRYIQRVETADKNKITTEAFFYITENGYILEINVDGKQANVTLLYPNSEAENAKKIVADLQPMIAVRRESRVNLITTYDGELNTIPYNINPPVVDLELAYGADFMPVYNVIIERLSSNKDKGLVILYGLPGTGKTTLIRHLIAVLAEKKEIIYLPPDLTRELASPGFIRFLMRYPESILIIEDAENVLKKRTEYSHQSVSNLLNLSDGLLSDCLNIQVVCTFNSELNTIDSALIRKGRLIARHYFGKLSVDSARRLAKQIGLNHTINEEMTLAELYNLDSPDFGEGNRKKIGFSTH